MWTIYSEDGAVDVQLYSDESDIEVLTTDETNAEATIATAATPEKHRTGGFVGSADSKGRKERTSVATSGAVAVRPADVVVLNGDGNDDVVIGEGRPPGNVSEARASSSKKSNQVWVDTLGLLRSGRPFHPQATLTGGCCRICGHTKTDHHLSETKRRHRFKAPLSCVPIAAKPAEAYRTSRPSCSKTKHCAVTPPPHQLP